jgi:hypothetical protein
MGADYMQSPEYNLLFNRVESEIRIDVPGELSAKPPLPVGRVGLSSVAPERLIPGFAQAGMRE